MTPIALALTLCLQLDGVDLGPVTLTEPLVTRADAAGATVRLGRWDAEALRTELRLRGFAPDQIRAALMPLRLASTEEVKCGTCVAGGMIWKPTPTCVEGKTNRSPCLSCKVCADPAPEPIACGEPPTGVRIVK